MEADAAAVNGSQKAKFKENEKVFAYHLNLIYEAKILKFEWRTETDATTKATIKKPFYFIHYQGWKDRWNEWVDQSRILKINPENDQMRRKLLDDVKSQRPGKTKGKEKTDQPGPGGKQRGKKRKAVELEDSTFPLEIPMPLRKKLLKDQKMIKEKSLVPLPRQPTVSDILKAFSEEFKPPEQAGNENYFDEVLEGVRLYFDKALGTILLYRFERVQYTEALKKHKGKSVSEIYGAEHLLRLFVKLPLLLSESDMQPEAQAVIKQRLEELLSYLVSNKKTNFVSKYESATPTYRRMAE